MILNSDTDIYTFDSKFELTPQTVVTFKKLTVAYLLKIFATFRET